MSEDSPRSTHPAESSLVNVTRIEPRLTPTGRFATFRAFLGVEPRLVEGLNYLDDLLPEVEGLAKEPELVRVIATTSKERSVLERMYKAIGKIIGAIPRNTGAAHTQSELDMDMDKFEGTCLDGVALSDGEIGLLKNIFRDHVKESPRFRELIGPYCEMRAAMLEKDPAFEEKYPNLFVNFLDGTRSTVPEYMSRALVRIRDGTDGIFSDMNRRNPNMSSTEHIMLLNRSLYDSGTDYDASGMVRQTKRGGIRSRRNRNRKSNKKYKGGKRTKKCRRSRR
jgi:hypothetical protein